MAVSRPSLHARAIASLLLLLLMPACATGPTGPTTTARFRLELFVERGGNSFARYLLTEDGQLHFGGGFDAIEKRYTWSGTMTEEEIETLRALLAAEDWFSTSPQGTGPPPPRYEIELERPGMERRLDVKGRSELLESLIKVLETAARRRHEDILRSLPQPGE